MKKNFKNEKDLKLFVKRFFKENLKGLPETAKINVRVICVKPPKVLLEMPFYSEGNLIRINEVDFLLKELSAFGIETIIAYLDDLEITGF